MENNRAGIIQVVNTPLGFFVLVMLVLEVSLGIVACIGAGFDRTLAITGMLIIVISLIVIVTYLSYKRPEALSGKREKIEIDLSSQIPPLREEIDRLNKHNEELKFELERITSFKSRVWAVLVRGGSVDIDDILRILGIGKDSPLRSEVMGLIGILHEEGKIESDSRRPPGYYKPKETK